MKRIAIFTGTRAEYGLLYWLMHEIKSSDDLELQLIASSMHMSHEFGETWRQIEDDGFCINEKIETLISSNTAVGVVKSLGLGTISFAEALQRLKPDILVLLGDRYEVLSIAQAALILGVPIAHIHGGEITEGAYDDAIRHAVTKMSHLHFTSTESHRRRVIQLGEQPDSVFNFGAIGLDHLVRSEYLTREQTLSELGLHSGSKYILVTYHPVTACDEDPVATFSNILNALDIYSEFNVIFTYPNSDNGGREIIDLIELKCKNDSDRCKAFKSLGSRRYLSTVKHAAAVLGNSSSGIIEVPAVKVPVVNVGVRQYGRTCSADVIHVDDSEQAIVDGLKRALSFDWHSNAQNPYGNGGVSEKIVKVLRGYVAAGSKKFFDINY